MSPYRALIFCRETLSSFKTIALLGAFALLPIAGFAQQPVPVGTEFQVNTHTTNYQYYPAATMRDDGTFVIVWQSFAQDGSAGGIFGQRFDATGMAVGVEFPVNTYTTSGQSKPDVGIDSSGGFVVAWNGARTGDTSGVQAQRFDATGMALGSEIAVNSYTTSAQAGAAVSVAGDGSFLIAWESDGSTGDDTDNRSIAGQTYNTGGVQIGTEFQVNTYTTNRQGYPSVAVDASGDFMIAWNSLNQDGDRNGVFRRFFDINGTAQTGEAQVNATTLADQDRSKIAIFPDGSSVIAFRSESIDGNQTGVAGRLLDNTGTPVGSDFQVNTYTTGAQGYVDVAVVSANDFVIIWSNDADQDGDLGSVHGRRFDASGTPLGDEFQVNTYTTSFQFAPTLASDGAGTFVVAWESYGQEGSYDSGVFARRYILDDDMDTIINQDDNCPVDANADQLNSDLDSLGDVCDNCPLIDNEAQTDSDMDGSGDPCDLCTGDDTTGDIDGDGVCADNDCNDNDGTVSMVNKCGVCLAVETSCEIFADDFELGNLSAWTSQVPLP